MPRAASATITVDNPAAQIGHSEASRTVIVQRALRDDPLGRLHARGQISTAQFRAGRRWQAAVETAEGVSLRSPDLASPVVDTSRVTVVLANLDRIDKARAELARWDAALGRVGATLIRLVLVNAHTMEQVAAANGEATSRAVDYYGRRLREILTTLAAQMGY